MEGLDLIMQGIEQIKSPLQITCILVAYTLLAALTLNWYRLIENVCKWGYNKIKNIIKRR